MYCTGAGILAHRLGIAEQIANQLRSLRSRHLEQSARKKQRRMNNYTIKSGYAGVRQPCWRGQCQWYCWYENTRASDRFVYAACWVSGSVARQTRSRCAAVFPLCCVIDKKKKLFWRRSVVLNGLLISNRDYR